MISNENEVNFNDYKDYQKNYLNYLRNTGYLSISENGTIKVEKPKDILLLKQLYEYQACPYWYYDSAIQKSILVMVERGWLVEDNHLLTPSEQDYFSYYLNNEKFTNGRHCVIDICMVLQLVLLMRNIGAHISEY